MISIRALSEELEDIFSTDRSLDKLAASRLARVARALRQEVPKGPITRAPFKASWTAPGWTAPVRRQRLPREPDMVQAAGPKVMKLKRKLREAAPVRQVERAPMIRPRFAPQGWKVPVRRGRMRVEPFGMDAGEMRKVRRDASTNYLANPKVKDFGERYSDRLYDMGMPGIPPETEDFLSRWQQLRGVTGN